MILVQSHRLRLSGNKLIAIFAALFLVSSCAPKLKVLKPEGMGETSSKNENSETGNIAENSENGKTSTAPSRNIALILPFELDKANKTSIGLNDVKRSSLALDFYQGFKIALDEQAAKGANFQLNVLDSRDNVNQLSRLASSSGIQAADLIVGPVYPKEISGFAGSTVTGNVLQVSPLAASKPIQFKNPHLVSLTASIDQHISALAFRLIKDHHIDDKLILVNDTNDDDNQKFIPPLDSAIQAQSKGLLNPIILDETSLNEAALQQQGKNVVVSGSANRYSVATLLEKLSALQGNGFQIQLFGHPNWSKLDLNDAYLQQLNTRITASYYIDVQAENVKAFIHKYTERYQVSPSEFSYKGYDAGTFFGQLLHKYGKDYPMHLTEESYRGLHNLFKFAYNPNWGYSNTNIMLLGFSNGQFRPLK
ncbi:substrate-binding protein [bacterium A37T11]|nr:substrate-binding protein [bacterium A37T11]